MSTYACAVIAAGSQGRVHAQGPLTVTDNALLSGLVQGFWQPAGQQHPTY